MTFGKLIVPRTQKAEKPVDMRAKVIHYKWMQRCKKQGAHWEHDGHPERPHALLTGGNHTGSFFNIGKLAEHPLLLDEVAEDLVDLLEFRGLDVRSVERVIGPMMGAITFAHGVARHISLRRHYTEVPCYTGYAEKGILEKYSGTVKIMHLGRLKLKSEERVLIVDDVRSGGSTMNATAQAVLDSGGEVLPYYGMLANRSGEERIRGVEMVSLVSYHIPMWLPEECPLCKKGSRPIRPKAVGNWALLTQNYPASLHEA